MTTNEYEMILQRRRMNAILRARIQSHAFLQSFLNQNNEGDSNDPGDPENKGTNGKSPGDGNRKQGKAEPNRNLNLPIPQLNIPDVSLNSNLGNGSLSLRYHGKLFRMKTRDEPIPGPFYSNPIFSAGAVAAIPIPKAMLPNLPRFIVGPYGRSFIQGRLETSVASLLSRRIGLGGDFGRLFPVRLFRIAAILQYAEQAYIYYEIIENKPSIEQVEDTYDSWFNPMLKIWRPIENYLKTFEPPQGQIK
ncbi:hypothetical protein QEG73_05420 [Chitinophagaceae bacterium 26-R-25]|nr:hypothetical protein [Chitinophagaceae bacterium 26-R-25]